MPKSQEGSSPIPPSTLTSVGELLQVGPDEAVELIFVISKALRRNRATTLQRVNGTLIGAGLAALAVAMSWVLVAGG